MFFWLGLAGVIATGLIVGMGSDTYWALAGIGSLDPSIHSSRVEAALFLVEVLAGLFDFCALGVVFAGGVIVVQRLRGVA